MLSGLALALPSWLLFFWLHIWVGEPALLGKVWWSSCSVHLPFCLSSSGQNDPLYFPSGSLARSLTGHPASVCISTCVFLSEYWPFSALFCLKLTHASALAPGLMRLFSLVQCQCSGREGSSLFYRWCSPQLGIRWGVKGPKATLWATCCYLACTWPKLTQAWFCFAAF